MKIEKIDDSKFKNFETSKIANLTATVGGYPGETGTGGSGLADSDQIKDGVLTSTANPSGVRNDGFQ